MFTLLTEQWYDNFKWCGANLILNFLLKKIWPVIIQTNSWMHLPDPLNQIPILKLKWNSETKIHAKMKQGFCESMQINKGKTEY